MYNNTIYAERDVIGDLDVIKNFDPQTLRDFYHDWYRTDLQAIVIVGDIDVKEVEQKVIKMFSAIPAVENAKERPFITIPDKEEPTYILATDKEDQRYSIAIQVRYENKTENTLAERREIYVRNFFNSLMKNRFAEATQKGDAPFMMANVKTSGLARGYSSFNINVSAAKGKEKRALEGAYTILQEVLNNGFTQSELDRLKTNLMVSLENKQKNTDKRSSESYCKALKNAYLYNTSLSDKDFDYRFAKEIVPGITLEEVSAVPHQLLTDKNRVYMVTGPEKEGYEYITLSDIEDVIAKVEAKDIKPYDDGVSADTRLLSKEPLEGSIVSEKKLDLFGATEWTLSNGVKVVYRFSDYDKESVSLKAVSFGGASLYEADDLPSFDAVNSFVKGFGIGEHDPISYNKLMTGKTASSSFGLGGYAEAVSGSAKINDLEEMFKLVYMRFTQPRFDKEQFTNIWLRNQIQMANKVENKMTVIQDSLGVILRNGNPRNKPVDLAYLKAMDYDRMIEIYKERYANAADFTFYIVGDVREEQVKPMLEKYIASLPASAERESWKKRKSYFPEGKNIHRVVLPMEEPKASVMLRMKSDLKYSRENAVYHSFLKSILEMRFTKNIREKEGGTYGVGVKSGVVVIPEVRYSMEINFDCDPDKADYLKSLVYKELNDIQKNVSQDELDKVLLNAMKNKASQKKTRSYWMGVLQHWYERGENKDAPEYFDDIIEKMTTKDIEKAAKRFFKKADAVEVVLLPDME
ncbi:MAG: insulinase family protein [Bacteroidales bacterium]|nr:insulinase family protein [Bacteroidales bacterium]